VNAARGRWQILAIVSVALAALVSLYVGRAAYRSRHSNDFCTASCHVDAGKHYAAVGHATTPCQSCHPVSIGAGVRLAGSDLTGSKHVRPHGKATAAQCATCHNPSDGQWDRIAQTEGHRKHPPSDKLDCLSCHKQTSHGKVASAAATCTQCHADVKLHKKADEHTAQCTSCHNFTLPGSKASRGLVIEACARCHSAGVQPSGEVVQAAVISRNGLHGGVDCKLCHQPHKKAIDTKRLCKSCHQIQIVASNPKLPKEHILCESCHEQHKPIEAAGSRCVVCHEQARPKTDGSKSTALRHDQCASCHLPHTWAAAPNECVNCHGKQANLVATKSPPQHKRCTNCHEVHGKPPSGATCANCHKENAAKMLAGGAPPKHQNCTSCHNPHAPEVKVPATCSDCHKQPLHQLVTLGPAAHAKASCQACHTVHGNPRADTKTCATCHKEKNALVAKATRPEHQNCKSCHGAHKFSVDPVTPPCARCHTELAAASLLPDKPNAHNGKCIACHVPHGAPAVAREKCLGCHDKINLKPPTGNVEHARCASCHKPHSKATSAPAKCATCHADKAKVAATWPVGTAHREKCSQCHQPHDVVNKAACGSCHEKQQAGVTGTKHECKSCHAVHQSPPADHKAYWNKCAGCHATQAKEVAGSKKHDKCASCHQPHKFAKPDCKTCHAKPASKGLHTVKGHADCNKCHQTHTASLPVRSDCLSTCHTNKANHIPEAKTCTGCHLFKD